MLKYFILMFLCVTIFLSCSIMNCDKIVTMKVELIVDNDYYLSYNYDMYLFNGTPLSPLPKVNDYVLINYTKMEWVY